MVGVDLAPWVLDLVWFLDTLDNHRFPSQCEGGREGGEGSEGGWKGGGGGGREEGRKGGRQGGREGGSMMHV